MSLDHHHFPTFDKMGRVIGPVLGWLCRHLLNERSMLRLALYGLLVLSASYAITERYLEEKYGMSGGPMSVRGRSSVTWSTIEEDEGWAGAVHSFGRVTMGESMGVVAPVIATLCLVGLALGARGFDGESRGRWWLNGRAVPREVVTAGTLEPPSPPPPRRHPLDPDPDDLPLEPLWPNRSRPSK